MGLIQELESYGGDPSNIFMSRKHAGDRLLLVHITHFKIGNLTNSSRSDSSGSTVSDTASPSQADMTVTQHQEVPPQEDEEYEEASEFKANELPSINVVNASRRHSDTRPQSSLSSHRYRTPMAGSLVMSPPLSEHVPLQQPLPGFETPSAFAESTPFPSSLYPTSHPFAGSPAESSRAEMVSPIHLFAGNPRSRAQMLPHHHSQYEHVRPASALALESAVENVQVQLAALSERLETLESRSLLVSRSNICLSSRGSPQWAGGRGSPSDRNRAPRWDIDDLGMWSFVLNPFSNVMDTLRDMSTFFSRDENRSPSMIIIRRLCLDVSFLLCVIGVVGAIWRKSGNRRREVRVALVMLWRAIVGSPSRVLVDRGV